MFYSWFAGIGLKTAAWAVAIALVLGICGTYYATTQHEISSLKLEVKELTTSVETEKANVKVCTDVNVANQDAMKSLLAERDDALALIAKLNETKVVDAKTIANLRDNVSILKKDPKKDGEVSEVLRSTLQKLMDAQP